jgi:hypothetical protein
MSFLDPMEEPARGKMWCAPVSIATKRREAKFLERQI